MTRLPRPLPVAALATAAFGLGACSDAPTARPNFLVVTVDTLRADYLEPYGDSEPISPALQTFADSALVFDEAWSTSTWTLPSLSSLHTGLLSSAHGCWRFESRLDQRFETLAERLSAAGYDTAAVVNHIFLGRPHGLNQGFVTFDDELVLNFGRSHDAITSEVVADRGVEFIEAKADAGDGRPWLLWLHFFDPHEVYHFHEEWSPRFGVDSERQLYRGEIAYTDHHIGRVLRALDEGAQVDDTVVLVCADHGEEWEEQGDKGHGFNLHRETLRIPFILRAPGAPTGRVSTRVSLVDVAPTLLELAGLPPLPGGTGRSLVPTLEGRALPDQPVVAELERQKRKGLQSSIGSGRWKLMVHAGEETVELFDVEADPNEQIDLAAAEAAVTAELLDGLSAMRALSRATSPVEVEGESVSLSEAEIEALAALGYVEDE